VSILSERIQTTLKGEKIIKDFTLNEARRIAEEICDFLKDHVIKIEIVGSIRRKRNIVHDIDIVAVAKPYFLQRIYQLPEIKMKKSGKKLIEFEYKKMQVDVYLSNEETFETIRLIRTGSAEHNKKLCMIAIRKGMHLYANGGGLWKEINKVTDTEEGILKELLGKVPLPEERE
jgi:DNA polymerase/3'-5' exonuclease PolX